MRPFYEYHEKLMSGYSTQMLNFPLHLHGGPELVRIKSGLLRAQIHSKEYDISAGHIVIIFPNVIHSFQTLSSEEDTQIDLIICRHDTKNGFPGHLFGSILNNPILSLSQLHPDADYLFSSLMNEISLDKLSPTETSIPETLPVSEIVIHSKKSNDDTVISTILQLLWLRFLPYLDICPSSKLPASYDMPTAVIRYISEHFCEPLSLEKISKELGICRFYLSRIFTQILHTGFHEYVNTLRIDYAKKLLLESNNSILDIAIQSGFQNQQTFNRVFKEITALTPSNYRKNSAL